MERRLRLSDLHFGFIEIFHFPRPTLPHNFPHTFSLSLDDDDDDDDDVDNNLCSVASWPLFVLHPSPSPSSPPRRPAHLPPPRLRPPRPPSPPEPPPPHYLP